MKLRIATDFSGIGVPEMALEALKIPHTNIFACEKDKFTRTAYLANFKPQTFYDDITTRNHSKVGPIDLYIAGFPCQSFSLCGLRKGFDDVRGTLFFDMAQFIKINRPKVFILENVKGLLSHDKPKNSTARYGNTFNTIINLLAQTVNGQYALPFYTDNLGYHIYYKVINSVDFGVPQNRERIFIVGFRDPGHTFNFPSGFPLQKGINDLIEENPHKKYNISKAALSRILRKGFSSPTINARVSGSINTNNNSGKSFDNGTTLLFRWQGRETGTVESKFAPTLLGTTRTDIKNRAMIVQLNQPRHSNDRIYSGEGISSSLNTMQGGRRQPKIIKNKYGKHQQDAVFDGNGISPTLQSSGNGHVGGASAGYLKFLTQTGIRRLTPLECFRLQDIPDDMYWNIKKTGMSDSQLYKQAGNAMTRSVMIAIISQIIKQNKWKHAKKHMSL